MTAARWWWCTAPHPGAVAVACVAGSAAELDALALGLTGKPAPAIGALAWRTLAAIDDGVLARTSAHTLLVMPHGGLRIRAHLDDALAAHGALHGPAPAPDAAAWADAARATYPEAHDALEALALATLATAASPRAVDLLLAQPARWRAALGKRSTVRHDATSAARDATSYARDAAGTAREAALERLLAPARVVVTGPANAGKSTLMNALAGRAVAVAHDEPGTTRDAVAVRLDLDGVVVDWFDTPGVRSGASAVEVDAQRVAAQMLEHADLVVQLSAPGLGWRALAPAQAPALRVLNKCDVAGCEACDELAGAELRISARRGDGLAELAQRVRTQLVPDAALEAPEPWAFCAALRDAAMLECLRRVAPPHGDAARSASATLPRP